MTFARDLALRRLVAHGRELRSRGGRELLLLLCCELHCRVYLFLVGLFADERVELSGRGGEGGGPVVDVRALGGTMTGMSEVIRRCHPWCACVRVCVRGVDPVFGGGLVPPNSRSRRCWLVAAEQLGRVNYAPRQRLHSRRVCVLGPGRLSNKSSGRAFSRPAGSSRASSPNSLARFFAPPLEMSTTSAKWTHSLRCYTGCTECGTAACRCAPTQKFVSREEHEADSFWALRGVLSRPGRAILYALGVSLGMAVHQGCTRVSTPSPFALERVCKGGLTFRRNAPS